jgi:hypothetical protein
VLLICTGVNRGLLTICTNCTDFLPVSVSMVAVNCDPLISPATHSTRFPSSFGFVLHTQTNISVLSHLGWLSPIIIYSRVSYCYYYLNLIGYITFNNTYYLEDTNAVLTVQWIDNTPVLICYILYRTVGVYLLTKHIGMIGSIRLCCSVYLLWKLIPLNCYSFKYWFQYKYVLIYYITAIRLPW